MKKCLKRTQQLEHTSVSPPLCFLLLKAEPCSELCQNGGTF